MQRHSLDSTTRLGLSGGFTSTTASTSTDKRNCLGPPDVTAPTVTINQAAGQADPTLLQSILFDVPVSAGLLPASPARDMISPVHPPEALSASVSGTSTPFQLQ
jgi:hypothetical protein